MKNKQTNTKTSKRVIAFHGAKKILRTLTICDSDEKLYQTRHRYDLLGEVVENADDRYKQLRLVGLNESGQQWHGAVFTHHHAVTSAAGEAVQRQGSRACRPHVLTPVFWCGRLQVQRQLPGPLRRRRTTLWYTSSTAHRCNKR